MNALEHGNMPYQGKGGAVVTEADMLLVERRGNILILTLNRPHVRNALDAELAHRLTDELRRLEADPSLRVAVITGTGGFSSGMDLREFARTNQPPWDTSTGLAALLKSNVSKPVIAAVERFALAGGLELALFCDLIVASAGSVLGLPEVKRGLVAAGGGLRRLPAALPRQVSVEMALTGAAISAERAHELGLVNRLVERGHALDSAIAMAEEIAAHRPEAVDLTKQILDRQQSLRDDEFWPWQQDLVDPIFRDAQSTSGAQAFLTADRDGDAKVVRGSVDQHAAVTVPDLIRARAADQPDRVFLTFNGRTFTLADVDTLTNIVGNNLRRLGIGRGSHVAVFMNNSPEFLWVSWGLAKLGAVTVPLNTEARGDQLSYFLRQSESTNLVVDSDLLEFVEAVSPDVSTFDNLIHAGPLGRECAGGAAHRVIPLADLLEGDATPVVEPLTAGDLSSLNYTSGTTGPSKAAMSPHGQAVAVARLLAEEFGYTEEDVFYTCLPLFHVNAHWYTTVTALWSGASVVLGRRFSGSGFWREVGQSRATVVNLLGAMANILEKRPPSPEESDHAVRLALVAPTNPQLVDLFASRFGVQVISLFAATETFPITILPASEVSKTTAGSAGRVSSLAEISIVDAQGAPAPIGVPGEILVRPRHADTMSIGYWKLAEKTVESISGLWFHTGDRAYLDAQGYLHFVDRIKEVIRRRGENISSYEVESVILKHPDVLEAAAVPIQSDMSEDEVGVFVVRRPGASFTEADLIDFCVPRMAKFMVPRFVRWSDGLPRTASQKIEKYKLRKVAAESTTGFWDRERA